jgi:hypothetical protein
MLSRSSYTKNKNIPLGQDKNFIAVRSSSFYGLKFEKLRNESSSFKRGLVSSPNFIFYSSNTKVMVDFTDYKNKTSIKDVEEFFTRNLTSTAFTITEGEWYNPQLTSLKVSLNGSYTIEKFENNILFANVVSISNLDSKINRYDKEYFLQTPNFDLTVSTTQENDFYTNIVNIFGKNSKNSFSYLGVQVGDIIGITDLDKKYQITDIKYQDDGKEVITVAGSLSYEDRTSSLTNIVIYTENKDDTDVTKFSTEIVGQCNVISSTSAACYDNQSELQCYLRKNSKIKQTASFTKDAFCPEITENVREDSAIEKLTLISEQNNQLLDNLFVNQSLNFRR